MNITKPPSGFATDYVVGMPDSLTWRGCIRFDVNFDLDIGAGRRRETEFHKIVSGHPEISALRSRCAVKGRTRRSSSWHIAEHSFEGEAHRHHLRDAADSQRAVHNPSASGRTADAVTAVCHCGKFSGIKEVRPAKIVIAHRVLRTNAVRCYCDLDNACGRVRRSRNGSANLVEPATHDSNYMMSSAEVRKTVDGIDLVGPRRRQRYARGVSGLNLGVCRSGVCQRGRAEDQKYCAFKRSKWFLEHRISYDVLSTPRF
jgi:hypothetical protein